ncbi:energy-coupling factor transporter transmembrane component T family protein [Homoserinibacter sp. YIM 151385]|uniref:energy-coupling factor transporter transmembrane component T family protein n=1 Tax=Homoserinibacter sp. YIM 151385 TaxID=2985506 RepID=UPI0022F0D8F1|nr:energy-coupling factor transporter transmembrane component T [Homoserinibacter sp. YIM 151385]WBU37423.1 energy-coupling factor transporter transmembrane component T [Homoserinibacter sp. YIM 151385]
MSALARGGVDPYAERVDHGPLRFLHRLNPLAKVAGPLPLMVAVIFTRDLGAPLGLLLLALLLLLIGAHLRPRAALAVLGGIPLAVLVLSFSFGLWADPVATPGGPALLTVGSYQLRLGAWLVGLATALRLLALVALSLLAGLTTTGPDLVRSMVQQLRVPYRIGYTALAAFRFVPRFGHELDVIRRAHRIRGMAGGRGPVAGLRRRIGYLVPLLAGAIRHAERVALAMDARAFGAHPSRTERHRIPFRPRDVVFIVLVWVAGAAVLVVSPDLVHHLAPALELP